MKRELIPCRISPFTPVRCRTVVICGISDHFWPLFPSMGQIVHALLTRPPLTPLLMPARLACIRHAASVSPEPGSNSHVLRSYTLRDTALNALFATSPVQGVQASPAKGRLPCLARVYDLKTPSGWSLSRVRLRLLLSHETVICLE